MKKILLLPGITKAKAILILSIVGILVFSNSLFNNFIGDDNSQIVRNSYIHSLSNFFNFFSSSTFYNGPSQNLVGTYYKPFLSIYFSVIYTLAGAQPFLFHFFQIALHIANTILLCLFLNILFSNRIEKKLRSNEVDWDKLSGSQKIKYARKHGIPAITQKYPKNTISLFALFLSLVFLVHPINSEAVFFIASAQDPLFFFFGIFALWLLTFESTWKFFLALFFLFFSLLAKETGILFFILSFVYIFLFKRKYIYTFTQISTLLVCSYVILRIHAIGLFVNPRVPIAEVSSAVRLLNIPEVLFYYLKTFAFPLNLSAFNNWVITSFGFTNLIFPLFADLCVFAVIILIGFMLHKKTPQRNFFLYLFFSFWFLLGLLFHSQLLPLDTTVAQRWFYFPIVGILGMAGVIKKSYEINLRSPWIFTLAGILLLVFSLLTFTRSFDWRNDYRLAIHDVRISQNDYSLENVLSAAMIQEKKYNEAKVYAERSVSLFPYFGNYSNLGAALLYLHDYKSAREVLSKAINGNEDNIAYENLAYADVYTGDFQENFTFIKSAIEKFPEDYLLWTDLALLEYRLQNYDNAKFAIQQAKQYDKDSKITSIYKTIMSTRVYTIVKKS